MRTTRTKSWMFPVDLTIGLLILGLALTALAREAPPVMYRGAPIIPYAKETSEHRFRSPRDYSGTLDYYKKTFGSNSNISREKIINSSDVRAVHFRNKDQSATWEGLNIYEYKGACYIFVVFDEKELQKIAEEKKKQQEKGKKKKP